jgi:tetratricopeptide (TPR) repeat protein
VTRPPAARARRPRRWARALRQLGAALLFLALLELLLAALGVRPLSETEDPYVGFSGSAPLFEEQRAPDGTLRMATAPGKSRWFNAQSFAVPKPADTLRIFTLGGSTTYGHPFDDRVSYSGWLRELLPAADPSRRWEVINCGGISYASYREAVLMRELLEYEPDVFIVYAGPNEFLERRTYAGLDSRGAWLLRLGTLLSRTRLFTVARDVLRGAAPPPAPAPARSRAASEAGGAGGNGSGAGGSGDRTTLPAEVRTALDDPAGLTLYRRDDALRDAVLEHYRFNLERMADLAASVGARLVLVATASELRDCTPFKSQHGETLDDAAAARVDEQLALARAAQAADPARALALADQAVAADPRHALAHYRRGEALFALGRTADARAAFVRARDEDVCPLRPLSEMRTIVLGVAEARELPALDFVEVVDEACEALTGHRIPGHEQFLDHVHLDVDGYRLLALALLDVLARDGIARPRAGWEAAGLPAVDAAVRARIDREVQGLQLRNLAKTLGWAGKYEEAERLARQTLEVLGPGDSESHFLLGNFAAQAGRHDEAVEHYLRALALDPAYTDAHLNLADAALNAGRPDLAEEHLRAVTEQAPDEAQAWNVLALLLSQRAAGAEALVCSKRALELAPDDARVHHNHALVLARQGRVDEAVSALQRALKLDPDYAKAHFNLAVLQLRLGRVEQATASLQAALAVDPDYAEARAQLERLRAGADAAEDDDAAAPERSDP